VGPFPGVLLYFYLAFSDDATNVPPLSPKALLIPPVITNRLGWSDGYFQTIGNVLLSAAVCQRLLLVIQKVGIKGLATR
jgi:hypothetical protein